MKPSRVLCVAAVVVAAAAASVPTYLHASRSMNSNPQKKRERKMEGEREREKLRGEFHSMNGGAHRGTSVWNRSTGKMDDIEAR